MAALNRSTRRRLKKLPQIPNSVWEGDRRRSAQPLPMGYIDDPQNPDGGGDCILWVDGSQGIVRAMDVVSPQTGPAAVVRTLLRGMEHPHSPGNPARPQKIVVKDREIQFFLRGVLQELDIDIEYVPDLPLIDEIFRGFSEAMDNRPEALPRKYASLLLEKSYQIWQDAPWEFLGDHQILTVEINQWDVDNIYICVMGMLGLDYGILLYRSLDSLKQFRQRAIERESGEDIEEAFLSQDCLFVTFESAEELDDDHEIDLANADVEDIEPSFGNLHPLEGLRSILYEEEALITLVSLEALHRFIKSYRRKLADNEFPTLSSRYRIPVPPEAELGKREISVQVATLPEVSEELYQMSLIAQRQREEMEAPPRLQDDLVPENSFLGLGLIPWDVVELLRQRLSCYQSADVTQDGDGLPVILIQTTRPKAKKLIADLDRVGPIQGIGFNQGEEPGIDQRYDLGILQSKNGDLHLFGEFLEDDPVHQEARKKWDDRCQKTQGYCGLLIAMGLTGASRGNPQLKDMMGLFEVRSLSEKDLGLGVLRRMPIIPMPPL